MAASLLSVPVPVSVVVAAPPLLANSRNPRLLGLWLALGSSLDLEKYTILRQKYLCAFKNILAEEKYLNAVAVEII